MDHIRFLADGATVVLVAEASAAPKGGTETRSAGLSATAPPRIEVTRRPVAESDVARWGAVALLDEPAMAQSVARCLNAALRLDRDDIAVAARALEILVDQQLATIGAEDPAVLMSDAMRYVLKQERWVFAIRQERRSDGVRLRLDNPNGDPVPLSVHVSTRGRTPSFWVMQDSRIIQGSHAYKIPIQAATALQQAVQDYLDSHDTGTIRSFG
jgi:hypothetical protein